jgi:hypothetical protein
MRGPRSSNKLCCTNRTSCIPPVRPDELYATGYGHWLWFRDFSSSHGVGFTHGYQGAIRALASLRFVGRFQRLNHHRPYQVNKAAASTQSRSCSSASKFAALRPTLSDILISWLSARTNSAVTVTRIAIVYQCGAR